METGKVVRRSLATWTFYAVFYAFTWLAFSTLGLGAAAPDATAVGVDFAWLYPMLLAFVPVVGLLLLSMKRRV